MGQQSAAYSQKVVESIFVCLFLRTFKSIFFSIWPHQPGFVRLWHQEASKACVRIKERWRGAVLNIVESIGPLPTSLLEAVMLASLFLKLFKAPPVLKASMLISSHVSQPFSKGQLRFKAFCLGLLFSHTHIKAGMLFKHRQQRKARLCCLTSYRLPQLMTERCKVYKQINQLIKVYFQISAPTLLLESYHPADFSSNPNQTYLNQLIKVFRATW